MFNKSTILIIMALCLFGMARAQSLEYYLPVGFQNPLLKSGQYIFSSYYNYENTESDQAGTQSETSLHGLTTRGYLGISDKITLNTNLFMFPRQTTAQSNSYIGGDTVDNLNLQTEVTLSYRPRKGFELWGTAFHTEKTREYGDRTYLEAVPVGVDPITGAMIYEERMVTQPGHPDLKYTSSNFRVGFTVTGNAW